MKLPRRYAPFAYGVIQAALTTGIATAIASFHTSGGAIEQLEVWLSTWGISWISMLPVVIMISPVIQRTVIMLTNPDELTPSERGMSS